MAMVISVVARGEAQVNRVIEGGVVPDGCIISPMERQDTKNKTYLLRRRTRTRGVVGPWISVNTSSRVGNRRFQTMNWHVSSAAT